MTQSKRPQVLIDGVAFESSSRLGIWRVFYETISRISDDIDFTILLDGAATQPLPDNVVVRRWKRPPALPSKRNLPLQLIAMPGIRRLERQFPDAIWHSSFYTIDPRRAGKNVVTLHDMISERMYAIGPFLEQRWMKRRCLERATKILAISNATAKDLSAFHPELSERTRVIYHGGEHLQSLDCTASTQDRSKVDTHYCLYVGSRYAYKNFTVLVDATTESTWPSDLKVVVAGQPFDDAEQAYIQARGAKNRVHHAGFASNAELQRLFHNASCFVYPSLLEGFGIPILESQINETIPILSDIEVFREVGGNGALYFDPHSASSLAQTVARSSTLIKDPMTIQNMSDNCKRFSWTDSANSLKNCYYELAGL